MYQNNITLDIIIINLNLLQHPIYSYFILKKYLSHLRLKIYVISLNNIYFMKFKDSMYYKSITLYIIIFLLPKLG